MSVNYNPVTPTNGLVLCLDSRNPRSYPGSGTTWFDLSGNNNHGTLTNGPVFTSNGFSFDGIDDHVTCGNPPLLQITQSLTVCAWVRYTTPNSSNQGIVAKFVGQGSNNRSYNLFLDNQSAPRKFSFLINSTGDSSGNFSVVDSDNSNTNTWYFLTGVYIPSTSLSLFVNSVLKIRTTSNIPSSIFNSTAPLVIGSQFDLTNPNVFWRGDQDNIRIYNRALSNTEIQQLFQAQRGRYGI